jgi:hypothetical protein
MEYHQLEHFSVCQVCGRVAPRGTWGWLDAPMRQRGPHKGRRFEGSEDPRNLRVVRCPEHWSEWALRNSVGRTKEMRRMMKELKAQAPPPFPASVDPFPLLDEPLPGGVMIKDVKDA